MKTKAKWLVQTRYDKRQNAWKRKMGFPTKKEATEAARDFRTSLWWMSFRVIKND